MTGEHVTLGGLRLSTWSPDEIRSKLIDSLRQKRRLVFAYVNVHAFNLADKITWFRQFINEADIVLADGQGVRFGCWLTGREVPPHVPITRWIWDFLLTCQTEQFSVFFLGGDTRCSADAVRRVKERLPRLEICGSHHGYFEKMGEESEEVIRMINAASPDVLIVGFGMPVQERWITDTLHKLNAGVVLPVGGCIDVIAGRRVQSPAFITSIGMEWLWRLIQDPRRLWGRYILGNPRFLWQIIRDAMHEPNTQAR